MTAPTDRPAAPWHDPLLAAARVLLYVLLAGLVLVMIVQVIGMPLALALPGDDMVAPIWGRVLALVATGTIIGVVVRLEAILASVAGGDPFVAANAARLTRIAGGLLLIQLLGFVAAAIGHPIGGNVNGFDLTIAPGLGGIAMALLVFILARVFRRGAMLRDECEGMV